MVYARLFALSLSLFCFTGVIAVAQDYQITDLGTLGGKSSEALGINVWGHVVGDSCVDGLCLKTHPFLWTPESGMHDLGTLPHGNHYAIATGINFLDVTVGASAFQLNSGGHTHAFLWTGLTGFQDLGTLGCPDITGANGINLFGQVVGTSTIAPCGGGGQDRAFVWSEADGMVSLGTLPGGTFSFGNAMNVAAQAVGYSDCMSCIGSHAFFWNGTAMQDLGVLLGGTFSAASGISDLGFVVGSSDAANSAGEVFAFLWTQNTGMHSLGTLRGGQWSSASAINDLGQVVGSSDTRKSATHTFRLDRNGRAFSSASHAFIWTADKGMRDLNKLIPCHSGWVLVDAHAINLGGQIVGTGTIHHRSHAFLLTPQ
jgi:probable HAF family extracellular repeat protein